MKLFMKFPVYFSVMNKTGKIYISKFDEYVLEKLSDSFSLYFKIL